MALVRTLLFGLAIWAIPFVVGVILTSAAPARVALAGAVSSVSICLAATVFSVLHLKRADASLVKGLLVGLAWAAICIAIDFPIFAAGMRITDYVQDVALAYLMVPIIAAGIGAAKAGANAHAH